MWVCREHDGVQLNHRSLVNQLPNTKAEVAAALPQAKKPTARAKSEKNYEVAKILATRKTSRGREYQVNWAPCHDNQFRNDETTWELASNLQCDEKIKDFREQQDDDSSSEASSQDSSDSNIEEVQQQRPPVPVGSKRCRKPTQLFNPQSDGANDTVRRGRDPAKKKQKKGEKNWGSHLRWIPMW